jgi:glutamate/tyrosine decarboxylase-like PLP-dependent enzyme
MTSLPREGRPHDAILEDLAALREGDAKWREGRVMSLVYDGGEAHQDLLKQAYSLYFSENGLNPMAFKSLRRMEADVVRIASGLFHGGPDTVGTLTSGGTESILLAVKAARERAHARGFRGKPELVVPKSAHVAFDKAAHYFGLRIRHVPLGDDFRVDLRELRRAIGRSTVLVAASAPQYPHGVIDPIGAIAEVTRERGVPFHVDACIGGFVLPWLERLGEAIPPWDFRVDGVTSISADLHKYGYAAKGASVLLYRDMSYLKHQFFIATDWPGGIYASPSMPGTRPGGAIAAAWAALQGLGESGYLDLTRRTLTAKQKLVVGVRNIPELRVLGVPQSTIVAFTSNDPRVDIYAVADVMEDRGWSVDRQQHPSSMHATLMAKHADVIDAYLEDLRAAVAEVRADPSRKSRGNAAMYGMMAKVPFRGMVRKGVEGVMEAMYGPGNGEIDLSKSNDGPLVAKLKELAPRALDAIDALRSRFTRR